MALTCYRCGQQGHFAKDCPNEEKRCYRCGQMGHFAADCPEEQVCYKCGETGHLAKNCTSDQLEGQDHRRCYRCGEIGHLSSECLNLKCFKCGQTGHFAKDCPNQKIAASETRCYKCGEKGHIFRDCPTGIENRRCYQCGEIGHLASHCPQMSRVETLKATEARDTLQVSDCLVKMVARQRAISGSAADGWGIGWCIASPLTQSTWVMGTVADSWCIASPLTQSAWVKGTMSKWTRLVASTSLTQTDRTQKFPAELSLKSIVKPQVRKRFSVFACLSSWLITKGIEKYHLLSKYRLLRLK